MTTLLPRARRLAAAALTLLPWAALALPPQDPWTLRHPATDPVAFHGVAAVGAAEGMGAQILYPAPNLAVALAAVLTHAAINEGVRSKRTQEQQRETDLVLEPLQPELKALGHAALMAQALALLPGQGATGTSAVPPAAPGWQVSSTPVFLMTQDRRTLLLDNTIGIFAPGEDAKPLYTTTVRVVSRPRALGLQLVAPGDEKVLFGARLLAHSLLLALRDAGRAAGDPAPFRSLRYLQGTYEKVERAQPLEAWCERQVMRTLRGWLLSAPVRPAEGAASCDAGELVRQ